MKQARLSFGTKRKDESNHPTAGGNPKSNDDVKAIEIIDDSSGEAIPPPAKKVRLSQESGDVSSVNETQKSPAITPVKKTSKMMAAAVKAKSPVKQIPITQSPAKTPSKITPVGTPLARTCNKTSSRNTPSSQTTTPMEVTSSPTKRTRVPQANDGDCSAGEVFQSPASTPMKKVAANSPTIGEKSRGTADRTPVRTRTVVTTPSSGNANTTLSSQSPDSTPSSQTEDASPKQTPGRTPRRSKTETAFLELKRRKDRELRRKEKEEKIKLKEAEKEKREEERLRREQERQEAKERKEKERLEKEKKREAERLEKERKKEEERLEKEKERDERERLRKEKERKKEEERLEKEKEREEKERIRREKEEERRKKDEEKRRELEEEEAKKQRAKQAFKSFFVVKKTPNKAVAENGTEPSRSGGQEDAGTNAAKTGGEEINRDLHGSSGPNDGSVAGGSARYGVAGSAIGLTRFKPFQLKKDMELAAIVPLEAKARFDRIKFEVTLSSFASRTCTTERSTTSAQDVENGDAPDKNGNTLAANHQHEDEMLYIDLLKKTNYCPLKTVKKRVCKHQEEDSDCVLIQPETSGDDQEPTAGGRMRAKLLQFVENCRPAYYGTWRKRCPQITGRCPFNKFEDFDYSVDSDDEWEDVEGEVESLVGTDDEKDKEENGDDDYIEDEFFVPHGYLSESEEEESDDQPLDPEAFKARIAARQEEFTADRKAGVQTKKMVGVCAVGREGHNLEAEFQVLQQFKAVLLVASQECPLKPSWERESDIINTAKTTREHLEPKMLTDDALRIFCETAHGFQSGVRQLYEEFYKRWRSVSDLKIGTKSLKLTLTGTCKKSKRNTLVVNQDLVQRFGLTELDRGSPNEGTLSFSAKLLPNEALPDLIKVAHGTSTTTQVVTEFLNQMKGKKFGKAQVKRTLRSIAAFEHVQSCWLVKPDILKAHNLEELNKKIKSEEKPAKDKRETLKKDSKDMANEEEMVVRNKDKTSRTALAQDSNSKDSSASDTKGKENVAKGSTPKSMSIRKFFNISAKNSGSPGTSDSSASIIDGTPKVKKRIQPTTLSRIPTMKLDSKPQPVLKPDEVMVIIDDD
ncbi:hypothetical protein BIW11_07228 [Tropilaelaps mercedesae]|uniref:Chromatin assembly factor 1 subunit A-like n=1 Tax=Tropilaelaps mercedesae TaxID=418985 RepID=A0A1V9XUZ8_9ACAR|nr:hypothetical protein BIW11_07228 [Tropilaelaps mercedesae]